MSRTRMKGLVLLLTLYFVEGWIGRTSMTRSNLNSLKMQENDRELMDQMAKALGEREDPLTVAEDENKAMMKGLRGLDLDPNVRANSAFVEWLEENGVWVKQESAWGRAPHPLVISSQTEDDGESCGRGLLARESMSDGELMMTIPLDICLTKEVAKTKLGSNIITEEMDEYIAIALLLMSERIKGNKSLWKAYFDVLPTTSDVYPAFIWKEEELSLLQGSPTYAAATSLKGKLDREYELLTENVFKRYPNQFNIEDYNKDLFTWSFIMLFSRAARLSNKIGGEELALVPYADLMNHNPYSNTYIDAQRSGMPLISKTEEVAVYADRPYKKFEQVFINYGEKGNSDLLLLYGFALERNPFNSVEISVGLSKDDPLYAGKRRYLDRAGRGMGSVRFPLQGSRYPSELVDFLRLLLVETEDLGLQSLEQTDFNEPISPSLERRVLSTMISICESYLEQYPTTLDEDRVLMEDRDMFGALSRQQRMAVKLRVSEKRILYTTIRAIKEELVKLPKVVQIGTSGEERIVPAGRSFDEVTRKQSVASAKSPVDFVEIKGDLPLIGSKLNPGKDVSVGVSSDKNRDGSESQVKESIAARRRKRRGN